MDLQWNKKNNSRNKQSKILSSPSYMQMIITRTISKGQAFISAPLKHFLISDLDMIFILAPIKPLGCWVKTPLPYWEFWEFVSERLTNDLQTYTHTQVVTSFCWYHTHW